VSTLAVPTVSTTAPPGEFLSAEDESRTFWRLRWRIARTLVRQTYTRARFRAGLVLLLSLLLWMGLFILFAEGFKFLSTAIPHPETLDQMVHAIFAAFFVALLVMLALSSAIISYSALFRSPETAYLLTLPARTEHIFLYKFQEAVLLSSWGFVLLGSPMLLAYGLVDEAPWYYYVLLPPYLFSFVYIPAGIGTILCMLVIYLLPNNRRLILSLIVLAVVAVGSWYAWSLFHWRESDLLTPGWFREMLSRLQFTEGRLLPSWWLSAGLLEAARDDWPESVMFMVLLLSNALFCRQAAVCLSRRCYRAAYNTIHGTDARRKRARASLIDRAVMRLTGMFPSPMRLLMVKDLRLFRRDPLQWSQFLILFGLLLLYFVNIRRLNYDLYYIGYVNMVSFLNVAVVGLLMSTFTTRFIFPLVSLEGQRFWLIGLFPISRETILWSKYWFAAGGTFLPCLALILLSDLMLDVATFVMLSHQLTCMILCFGLAGIAVGLGAWLPNFREQSPSRIASGFGGTLCLVLSTLYILAVVLLTAVPTHFYIAQQVSSLNSVLPTESKLRLWLKVWLWAGTGGSVFLGAIAASVPMYLGFRAFRKVEF
jgi:ABC-2 type transport system permease protein